MSSNETNSDFLQSIEKGKCTFDTVLREKWEEAQKKGVFRYVLNIQDSRVLDGKYQFLAQLNVDRGYKRRTPENITSMLQPFDDKRFNFTKLAPKEKLMDLSSEAEEDIIAVNVSPIEDCHCLLLPQLSKRLPQIITKYSLCKAIELFSLSSSLYLRVVFNSLCAHASVNHLHWHLYYLKKKMLLEYIDLEEYAGPVQILKNCPSKGFCIKYSSVKSIDDLVTWSFLVIDYLQKAEIAHNVYITRARASSEGESNDLRMYIWARKLSKGIKDTSAFVPAACELFGHLSIKSEEAYKHLTEEYVTDILIDITEEIFLSVFNELRTLIETRLNTSGS